jgi:hypothetical protein
VRGVGLAQNLGDPRIVVQVKDVPSTCMKMALLLVHEMLLVDGSLIPPSAKRWP